MADIRRITNEEADELLKTGDVGYLGRFGGGNCNLPLVVIETESGYVLAPGSVVVTVPGPRGIPMLGIADEFKDQIKIPPLTIPYYEIDQCDCGDPFGPHNEICHMREKEEAYEAARRETDAFWQEDYDSNREE